MEIKMPDMNGSNASLRAIIRKQVRDVAAISDHLAQMGQYMATMMKAHHEIMALAWKQHKLLNLIVVPGAAGGSPEVLLKIVQIAEPFAAEYKKMTDTTFQGDKDVAMHRNAAQGEPETVADIPANANKLTLTVDRKDIRPNDLN